MPHALLVTCTLLLLCSLCAAQSPSPSSPPIDAELCDISRTLAPGAVVQCSRSDLSVTTATSTSGAWAASVVIAALLLIPLAVYFYSPGFRSWKPGDTAASLGALRAAAACAPPAATTTVGTGAVFVARRAHLAHQLLLSTFAVGCAGWLLLSSSLALSWESCDTALYPDDDPDNEFPQTLFFQAAFAPFS